MYASKDGYDTTPGMEEVERRREQPSRTASGTATERLRDDCSACGCQCRTLDMSECLAERIEHRSDRAFETRLKFDIGLS